MQNRYFGDVGDFGKFGLLRALCGLGDGSKLNLGVVWYLYPDENHNADGKHLGYLRQPGDYRDCDEQLFDLLHSLLLEESGQLIEGARQIKHAETSGILPELTKFYCEPLSFPVGMPFSARKRVRYDWFAAAQVTTLGVDLIFVDPDNGIECKVKRTAKKGPKYVYWDDLKVFVERGQTVIVYHHLGRNGTHDQQIERLVVEMLQRFPMLEVIALKFKRGSGRAYFILAAPTHQHLLRARIHQILAGRWKHHFSLWSDTTNKLLPIDEPDPVQLCNEATIAAALILDRMEDESLS